MTIIADIIELLPSSPGEWAGPIIAVTCSYLVVESIRRLYFHPLAKVPGTKLAALTLWYEFYHDFIRKGRYLWVIGDMHAKYGKFFRTLSRTKFSRG